MTASTFDLCASVAACAPIQLGVPGALQTKLLEAIMVRKLFYELPHDEQDDLAAASQRYEWIPEDCVVVAHEAPLPAEGSAIYLAWCAGTFASPRDIEVLLFERGVVVSYETIHRWCDQFGGDFAHRVKATRRKPDSTWQLPGRNGRPSRTGQRQTHLRESSCSDEQ
ncbi:hypothetical protein CF68_04910 [Cupriavidus sp. SK-4]|nr:hypothetical protein CF68_04910 [Cupriavidus sp. SK-4]